MEQLLSTEYIVSILLSGISLGGQLALIAIGYTMVYGILRLINFAHGDVFMVAGLLGIYISAALPMYVAIPIVIALTIGLGFFIERAAYKPLRSAPRMSVMISAIGVSYEGVSGKIECDDIGDAKRDAAFIKTANTEAGAWDFVKIQSVG